MAISRQQTAVTWDTGSASKSISAASNATSDAFEFDAACVGASVSLYADHSGTPGSGDTVDFFALYSSGDQGLGGADIYDQASSAHAEYLGTVDTFTADPSQISMPLDHNHLGVRIYAVNNDAGAAITVRAQVAEVLG